MPETAKRYKLALHLLCWAGFYCWEIIYSLSKNIPLLHPAVLFNIAILPAVFYFYARFYKIKRLHGGYTSYMIGGAVIYTCLCAVIDSIMAANAGFDILSFFNRRGKWFVLMCTSGVIYGQMMYERIIAARRLAAEQAAGKLKETENKILKTQLTVTSELNRNLKDSNQWFIPKRPAN
jgi:hypothetical protein